MFGFPVNLQDSGVQKFTNDADSGFPKITQREVFYSVKNGFWHNFDTWQTASGRVGLLPSINDDVYIRNTITYGANNTTSVNNVYNFVSLILNGITTLNVNNIFSYGNLNISSSTLTIRGNSSFIDNTKTTFTSSTITYLGISTQNIIPLSYNNLTLNNGNKTIESDLTINGNLNIGLNSINNFDLKYFNLIVNGTTSLGGGILRKYNNEGTLLFIGSFGTSFSGTLDFIGNVNVEFRNGYSSTSSNVTNNTGTGTWAFTTNNQILNVQFQQYAHNCKIEIRNGITLTITNGNGGIFVLNDTINGVNSLCKLTMGLNGIMYFNTQLAAESAMSVGIYDFTTNANTIGYTGNYTATIPSYFNTFHNLTISGTGTKSLGVNTTLNGNLAYGTFGILECSTYNLTVNGTTNVSSNTSLLKSGAGNLLFVGQFLSAQNGGSVVINFSGNPNVEFRNGLNTGVYSYTTFNTGTGQWKFSTSSQNWHINNNNLTYNCSILISGNIVVSVRNASGTESLAILNNTIDGDSAGSQLFLGNGSNVSTVLALSSTITAMATAGTFDFTTSIYAGIRFKQTGSYTIPYTSFRNLDIDSSAISTATLSGDTTIAGNLRFYAGVLECSSYALTVNGTTTSPSNIISGLKKNSSTGSLLFVGNVNMNTNGPQIFDLSVGNPNVELRGGFGNTSISNYATTNIKTGTGVWMFTTNNQSLVNGNNNTLTLDCSIVISGSITLTTAMGGAASNPLIFNGSINGDNALSKLLVSTNLITNYKASTQPMATGILDTSTNLNTWIYGLNNQDIKGSPTISPKQVYRNLTLNGTGVKTLQGYVSVLNTYTLTAPATLANNGFTLTNP